MRYFHDLSLLWKQMLVMLTITLVALAIGFGWLLSQAASLYRQSLLAMLTTRAGTFGAVSAAALEFDDAKGAEEILRSLSADENILSGALYSKFGELVASYRRSDALMAEVPARLTGEGHDAQPRSLAVWKPVSFAGERVGWVYLKSDLELLFAYREKFILTGVVILAVPMLVAAALSLLLQQLISIPLMNLLATTRAVAKGNDFSQRAVKAGNDELGQLVDGFNAMLVQLQARDADLQGARDLLEKRVEERTEELRIEIAERRRSERVIKESHQFLQSTLDALSAEITILDESGTIVSVNAARDRFARENESLTGGVGTGANYLAVCDRVQGRCAEDAATVAQGIRAVIAGEMDEFHREYSNHSATEERWFIVHVTRFGEAGARRIVVAHENITERKEAERKFRISDLGIKAVSQGVVIAGPDRKILTTNRAFAAITGYSESEILGRNCNFLQGPLSDAQTITTIRLALENLTEFSGEVLNYRKDGVPFWNALTISPVRDEQSRLTHFIGVIRDITARKQAEAQLEDLNRQLLDVSRQAGMAEVATSVLHNVGNVLNSVNVSTTLLGDRLRKSKTVGFTKVAALVREHADDLPGFFARDARAGQLPAYLEQFDQHLIFERKAMLCELEQLRKNVEHIKDIVAMQQNYARVSGVTEIVKPADLIEDTVCMNAGSLDRHTIEVVRQIADVPPIQADKHKVLQVLVNFLRNAKHACEESGRADKRIILRVEQRDDRVLFSVIDNGVGVPPENLKRIFNHGFTTKKDGHGFGLHSGANAAREMGGAVRVHSDGTGQGATFTLELPLSNERGASHSMITPGLETQEDSVRLKGTLFSTQTQLAEMLDQTCDAQESIGQKSTAENVYAKACAPAR